MTLLAKFLLQVGVFHQVPGADVAGLMNEVAAGAGQGTFRVFGQGVGFHRVPRNGVSAFFHPYVSVAKGAKQGAFPFQECGGIASVGIVALDAVQVVMERLFQFSIFDIRMALQAKALDRAEERFKLIALALRVQPGVALVAVCAFIFGNRVEDKGEPGQRCVAARGEAGLGSFCIARCEKSQERPSYNEAG